MVRLRPGGLQRPTARQRWMIYLSGLLGITAYFILENFGVQLSTAADASIIVGTYPLMTMLVELLIYRQPISLLRACDVLLAGTGAVLVVHNGIDVGGTAQWTGDGLLLFAGLVWAGYNVMAKRAGQAQDATTLTYYQTLAGAAGFILASTLEIRDWKMPGTVDIALLGYLAAACSVGGFLCYNYGLRRLPSSLAVNILNMVPVFGVVGAVIIDGETVQDIQLTGGVMTIAGVSIGMLKQADGPEIPRAADPVAVLPHDMIDPVGGSSMSSENLRSVTLTGEERKTLKGWAKKRTTSQSLALRARIVLSCIEGDSISAVAAKTVTTHRPSG